MTTTLMHVSDLTLKVQADVNTKTVITLMYMGDFRLKVQSNTSSLIPWLTSTCIDDSWF